MNQLKNILQAELIIKNTPLLFLVILYLATRLINLKILPIFTDEAIYSYWAQVALHDPANRFISLEDGKQPLFIWIAAIFQRFINDPLIASRLVSVASGFGSLIGVFLLAKTLFSERVAKIAAFLYVVLPFTLLYDRLALFDSLLTMFGIYSVLLLIKLAKDPKLDLAILSGVSIGLSLITKSSGAFFLYLVPFSLLFFNFKNKISRINFVKWLGLAFLVFLISQGIYNLLRLSPLFYIIGRKNLEFIRTTGEVLSDPLRFVYSNSFAMIDWLTTYIGWPLFIIFVVGLILAVAKRNLNAIFLLIYIFVPFTAEILFNKVLYPRFILFFFPYVILIISFAANYLLETSMRYVLLTYAFVVVSISFPVFTSFNLLTNPKEAKIATSDAGQYLHSWPAGFGVEEVVQKIKTESKEEEIYVGTEGTFGLLPYALQIYFYSNANVHFIGFWPVDEKQLPQQIIDIAKNNKAYFVFNENQKEIINPDLKLVSQFQKGKGNSYMRLYEVVR